MSHHRRQGLARKTLTNRSSGRAKSRASLNSNVTFDNMSSEIVESLLGVLLGGLLTAVGFMLRAHFAHRAKLNQALYALLELYRVILVTSGIDPRQAVSAYFKAIKKHFPDAEDPNVRAHFEPMMLKMIANIFSSSTADYETSVEERFTAACMDVAAVSPMLAARINGNRYLKLTLPALDEYLESVRSLIQESPQAVAASDTTSSLVRSQISTKFIKELQKDARHLAWRCGFVVWARCTYKFWEHNRESTQKKYEAQLRQLVEEMVQVTIDNAKQGASPT